MRTTTLALTMLLAGGLASGCSSAKSDPPAAPSCTLSPLGRSCGANAECCSGNCTNGTCVEPAGSCGELATPCASPDECCSGACNGTCVEAGTCGAVGTDCTTPDECCTNSCEGTLGLKKCVEPPGQCGDLGAACSANSECCNGNCALDPATSTKKCLVPPATAPTCVAEAGACTADAQCCSGVCTIDAPATSGECTAALFCNPPSAACSSDAQCCSLNCNGTTCSSTVCKQIGQGCASGDACCSGVCSVSGQCVALPSGSTGAMCGTLGEACAVAGDCCSTNCQGASGSRDVVTGVLTKDGTCKPAYTCDAKGDICYRSQDCCSGLCAPPAQAGQPGRCDDAPGGCALDGYPCSSDEGCCTRKCVDLGTGAKVCQPSGGCRLNGNYCDSTAACCNVNNLIDSSKWVQCDPTDHVCDNGGACNPPGDICGLNTNASQNCCFGKKDVCRYDSNGIPRCFGGPPGHCDDNGCDSTCPQGWDGNDPQCCIPTGTGPGSICQFRDQCCGFAPCVPGDDGVLRCAAVSTCMPKGATCSSGGPPSTDPCCEGSTCQNVTEVGWICAGSGGGSCAAAGGTCSAAADCCSGLCDATNHCAVACVPDEGLCTVDSDCCAGLGCQIAPGATRGFCTGTGTGGPTCAATGQSCVVGTIDCCDAADTCDAGICTPPASSTCSETNQACTAGGGECCTGTGLECAALDAGGAQVPCGGAGATGACFCALPSDSVCVPENQPCSTLVPCCTDQPLYCGSRTTPGAACNSINITSNPDTTDCTCKWVG